MAVDIDFMIKYISEEFLTKYNLLNLDKLETPNYRQLKFDPVPRLVIN